MAKLVFKLNGGNEEIDFPLEQGIVSIGSNQQNDISIDDDSLSDVHAELRRVSADGAYEITDFGLKSEKGIRVNGEEITQKVLQPGDVVLFGELECVFEVMDEEEARSPGDEPIARRATMLPPPRKSGELPKSLVDDGKDGPVPIPRTDVWPPCSNRGAPTRPNRSCRPGHSSRGGSGVGTTRRRATDSCRTCRGPGPTGRRESPPRDSRSEEEASARSVSEGQAGGIAIGATAATPRSPRRNAEDASGDSEGRLIP